MRFIIADTFMKSLVRLEKDDQNQVKQAAFEFQANPENPGASFHKLDRARDKRFWSFRVNRDIRIIVHRDGAKSLMLCYADHHDPAYQWAERRLLDVHPKTGAAQFVEIEERVQEVVRQVVRDEEPPAFAKFESDYLLGLGVPTEWLGALRTIGITAFWDIVEQLPEEAAERLIQLSEGKAVPLPAVATPTTDPFEHPDAQRRFRPMVTQTELQVVLDAPWDRWRIFLHPNQRELVEALYRGPARVTGGAGTGKSVVALHRAANLARTFPEAQVLLTTFSRALAVRLDHSLELLMGDEPARERVTVRHLHAEASRIALAAGKSFSPVSSDDLERYISKALRGRENEWMSPGFVRSEWEHVIDAHGLSHWEDYKSVSRKGRGVPLSLKKRKLVWAVMQIVLDEIQNKGQGTFNLLCATATEQLTASGEGTDRPYQHVIVDECQDFGPAELRLVRALSEEGGDDLFLCGDEGQRIYKGRVSWKSLGIDLRGRSKRLTLNYRTTAQIRSRADALMPSTVEDGDGEKESNATRSLLTGPQPEFCGYQSADEEQAALEEWLKERQTEGMALHEIALFARSSRCLKERAIPALQNAKCAFQKLSTEGVPEPDQVVVGSFHGAKGLEFRAVAIVGCDHDQVPLRTVVRRIRDAAERDDFIEQERHLLYVACTRARERLRVSWSGKGCEWLGIEKPKAEIMDQSKAKELGPQYSKDDAFTKRMRLHQSWYRSQVLGVPYGKGPTKNAKNYFGNMLTAEDADTGKNFLSSAIHKYAEQRMTQGEGAVEPYRLLHNMLSSQPMCFNLFGPLHDDLEMATTLVQAVWGDHIAKVTRVDVEWAPTPKDEYLDDKTAFDAFIEYETTSGDLGFIGIETKLTEPFSKKHVDKESYRRWMTAGSPWKPESAGAVADVKHNQLWRDHLLAWAMLRHPKTKYAEGSLAVVYHSQDARCAEVLEGYRGLLQSEGTLQAFTLEQLVAAWRPLVGESQWLRDFAVRYLELEGSDRRTG